MKEEIHPKYLDVEARCACGATWKTRSTKPELHLEICSNCHPFFTGKQKLIDTEGRVERFTKKYGAQTSESRKTAAKATKAKKTTATAALAAAAIFRSIRRASRCCRPPRSTPAGASRPLQSPLFNANACRGAGLARGARGGRRAPRSLRARRAADSRGIAEPGAASTPRHPSYRRARRSASRARAAPRSAIDVERATPRAAERRSRGAKAIAGARVEPGAHVHVPERERLARIANGVGAAARQVQEPRGERGEREQVEAVVLEHGRERRRIARAHEVEVARAESRSPARRRAAARRAACFSSVASEQSASALGRLRGVAVGRASRTAAPDAARRRAAASRTVSGSAVEQIPRLEQRRVERLAVEA